MPRLIVLTILLLFSNAGFCQPVVYINAGSRASYGNYQELTIEADGRTNYFLRETNSITRDSSSFVLSKDQLAGFFKKAEETGFFSLNTNYDSGMADGSGIYISMNHSGRKHGVHARNINVAAIDELIKWLNEQLASKGIHIYYGQTSNR